MTSPLLPAPSRLPALQWSLMFLPLMLGADPLARRVPQRLPLWVGVQVCALLASSLAGGTGMPPQARRLRSLSPSECSTHT